jgi:hypothetical protein
MANLDGSEVCEGTAVILFDQLEGSDDNTLILEFDHELRDAAMITTAAAMIQKLDAQYESFAELVKLPIDELLTIISTLFPGQRAAATFLPE